MDPDDTPRDPYLINLHTSTDYTTAEKKITFINIEPIILNGQLETICSWKPFHSTHKEQIWTLFMYRNTLEHYLKRNNECQHLINKDRSLLLSLEQDLNNTPLNHVHTESPMTNDHQEPLTDSDEDTICFTPPHRNHQQSMEQRSPREYPNIATIKQETIPTTSKKHATPTQEGWIETPRCSTPNPPTTDDDQQTDTTNYHSFKTEFNGATASTDTDDGTYFTSRMINHETFTTHGNKYNMEQFLHYLQLHLDNPEFNLYARRTTPQGKISRYYIASRAINPTGHLPFFTTFSTINPFTISINGNKTHFTALQGIYKSHSIYKEFAKAKLYNDWIPYPPNNQIMILRTPIPYKKHQALVKLLRQRITEQLAIPKKYQDLAERLRKRATGQPATPQE